MHDGGATEGVAVEKEPVEWATLAAAVEGKLLGAWVSEEEEDEDGLLIHSTNSSTCCG